MRIDVVTLFPEIYPGPLGSSIIGRAVKNGLLEIRAVDLREFSHDQRGTVDDKPYGGGPGMLMKVEPLFECVEALREAETLVVMTSPRGRKFDQEMAAELAGLEHLVIVCGHYEGVDERVRTGVIDREISIGDYILTSGNLAAMVMADAISRLLPGVLGKDESSQEESFSQGLLEYPQYTRPPEYRGMKVPEILLSGDHGRIAAWRRACSETLTRELRPDLWERYRAQRSEESDSSGESWNGQNK
ncbi:tRNA (guanosine(37)-N1)-methyltransferase TrmD [Victivallis sp. Marseille-Q1083]|uniref:tRNA (guanosine(37)-N1)-methyltransferase TrmD n=1 Tax=Victivallis sp. Marseille-Q1083 TaxID=2717288 RepID=UPI00158F546A|nr:tRNA (guanosine(37)-N1)-methyltransferase TrmD [Victivallis sp. Marseille-Q1083]